MKKSMLFSVALAGLMLGSCSSSDDLNGSGTSENKNGNGYVAFTINLPSQSSAGSRANEEFKDGLKSEYDVKDATLLLFDGSSETEATFAKAYKLNTAPWTDAAGDKNVTTTSSPIVKKVDAPTSHYYALVVLNKNGVFDLDQDGHVTFGSSKFNGKLDDFLKSATGEDLTKSGFFMANAPLANKPGGSADPTGAEIKTLVSLDGKIKDTEADAKAAPVDIYVERAVAKVTMQKPTATTVTGSKPLSSADEVKFEVTGWVVDNTNKTSYLVRNTDGFSSWLNLKSNATGVTNPYRFVGSSEVATGLYRTYFAKDMNYETDATDGFKDNHASMKSTFGDENPQYCFENTFNVDKQIDNQTSRVLIKAKLNDGQDFYVINGDENTIYKEDDVVKEIKNAFLTEYETWIKTNVTSPATVGKDQLTVNISDVAGKVTINSIAITGVTYASGITSLPDGYQTTVMNKIGEISEYKNGESYYYVRIKHFGDVLTPWKTTETAKPSTASVYPTGTNRDGNYLGRYGVLRNNWYDIEVTGVKGLGSAKVPSVTTTTDDELESYIAVRINVLSWAKRTQSTVLH